MEHQKNKESRLAEFSQNPEKALWKLAIPMMFGMFVQSIYMLTDTAYIGNWVGHEGLAALGYVWPYMFIIMGITFGLGSGATAVIAKYIGEKKWTLKKFTSVIKLKNRNLCAPPAPAEGLFLKKPTPLAMA